MANGYITQGDAIGFWQARGTGPAVEKFKAEQRYLDKLGYYGRVKFYNLNYMRQRNILRDITE